MATFKTFEQIEAWKESRELTKQLYKLTGKEAVSKDYGLKNQIRRASVSIMSNIAEGFERSGSGEFGQFLSMAKGSAGEARSQLYVAFDQAYLQKSEFDIVCGRVTNISRMISGLMTYLRSSGVKGTKFKRSERT
jgi:four helix bundle protein